MIFGNESFLYIDGKQYARKADFFFEFRKLIEKEWSIRGNYSLHRVNLQEFYDLLDEAFDNLHETTIKEIKENFN